MNQSHRRFAVAALCVAALGVSALAQQNTQKPQLQKPQAKIYWGDEVPLGWTGKWPVELQTVAERSKYTRTMTSEQNLEFITALRGKTESLHTVNMFTTALRKSAPAMIISSPRVTTPQQARASGKMVVFLFGN